MFKKEEGVDEVQTVIGPSVHVEGDFIAAGDVVVEGTVSGRLKTERNLKIGNNAKIFANIEAASALISGEVQGNIKVKENLELTSSAKIFGDVKANILTIASGAGLQGKCQIGNEKKSRAEKPEDKIKGKKEKPVLQEEKNS